MAGQSRQFWTEKTAWWTRHTRAVDGDADKRYGKLVSKGEKWSSSADKYLRGYDSLRKSVDAGAIKIEVDTGEYAIIAELIEALAPDLQAAYDEYLGEQALEALRDWPVSTGLSKTNLQLEYSQPSGGRFVGSLASYAPYTMFIKGQPHRKYIDSPADSTANKIGLKALDSLAKVK